MSSLGNLPGWDRFALREAPVEVEMLSPASELAAVVQKYRAAIDAAHSGANAARNEIVGGLAAQAVLVAQFATALDLYAAACEDSGLERMHRHLRVVKDQMHDHLTQEGIEIISPLGWTFAEAVDLVHVDAWRHGAEFEHEIVAQVVDPIIKFRGAVILLGRVVMGAPLESKPDAAVQLDPPVVAQADGE